MSVCAWWPLSLNVGDRLTPYLIEKITGHQPVYVEPSFDAKHFIIGGSVLNHAGKGAVVWGSGLGTITDGVNTQAKIVAVRGPISRARALSCGAECPAVYGDPALLVSRFFTPDRLKACGRLGIIPHYVDMFRADKWDSTSVISPLQDVEPFMTALMGYERIISSSLHGIIFAHMLGIPAAWVQLSDSVGGDKTKFRDYFASVGLDVPNPVDARNGRMIIPDEDFFLPQREKVALLTEKLWAVNPI